jgi:hypothetical protein
MNDTEQTQSQSGSSYNQQGQHVGIQYNVAGNLVYAQSDLEELRNYLAHAVPTATEEVRLRAREAQRPGTLTHPYKFLAAFTLEDAPFFTGRDAALTTLDERLHRNRLTILHARSGTGKSSLLNAGLAPRVLEAGSIPLMVRTTADPLMSLKRALAPPLRSPWPALLPRLTLHEFLGMACQYLHRRVHELVIMFDQFEEFLVATPNGAARQPFIADLANCYEDPTLPVRFLLSVRGDFFTDLADFQPHIPTIFHNEYRLEAMHRDDAQHAIQHPLTFIHPPCHYAPDLLDTLLHDLARSGIELPHLQIVCTRLYEALHPGETEITLHHYQTLGNAEHILGTYLRRAVEQFGQMAPLARAVLLELVSTEHTRQMLPHTTLRDHLIQRSDLHQLDQVLTALVTARLVQREARDGIIHYELAHDYLVQEIRAWVTPADLAARRAREALRRAVANWREHGWLLDAAALQFVHEQREGLSNLSTEELELVLRSAVAHQIAIDTWALAAHRAGLDIWPLLQPLLTADNHHTRASVISVLSVIGSAALPALHRALGDVFPLVRVQAIYALERLATDEAQQVLQAELRHEVALPAMAGHSAFYIDRVPVTNAAYQRFLEDTPDHPPPPSWLSRCAPQSYEEHPVTEVSWHDAQAYAAWAGKRLPTAAEWQQAMGGEQGQCYPWGNQFDPARCNTREARMGGTTPVGYYSPMGDSPAGVADMAGNVWEWLEDATGPAGAYRHLRGGAWMYSADFAHSDFVRFWRKPDEQRETIGFRLCLSTLDEEMER